MLPLSIHNKVR